MPHSRVRTVGFKLTDGNMIDEYRQGHFTAYITNVSSGYSKTVRDRNNHCPTELSAHSHSPLTRIFTHTLLCADTHLHHHVPGACSAAVSSQCVSLAGIQSQLLATADRALLVRIRRGCNRESQRVVEGETLERGVSPFCNSDSPTKSSVTVFDVEIGNSAWLILSTLAVGTSAAVQVYDWTEFWEAVI